MEYQSAKAEAGLMPSEFRAAILISRVWPKKETKLSFMIAGSEQLGRVLLAVFPYDGS
jgi:hypothetical protein